MKKQNIVDFRQTRLIKFNYANCLQSIKKEKDIKRKINLLSEFIKSNQRFFSVVLSPEDKNDLIAANKKLRELKKLNDYMSKKGFLDKILSLFFSKQANLNRKLKSFNLSINHEFTNPHLISYPPIKIIDVEFDNVNFELVFKSESKLSETTTLDLKLEAMSKEGISLGENTETLEPIQFNAIISKKIYVPSAAKSANKFLLSIIFK